MSHDAPSPATGGSNAVAPEARLHALADRLDERRIALERQHDSRCVFTCACVLITRRLARGLSTAGYDDPAWIVELAETFAGLYFAALDASAAGDRVDDAWGSIFKAIDRRHSSVLEDLVFARRARMCATSRRQPDDGRGDRGDREHDLPPLCALGAPNRPPRPAIQPDPLHYGSA